MIYQSNGVDTSLFDLNRFSKSEIEAFRLHLGIPKDALDFGFIGTFERWHDTDVLASSIADTLNFHGEWVKAKKVQFLIAGAVRRMRTRLSLQADRPIYAVQSCCHSISALHV